MYSIQHECAEKIVAARNCRMLLQSQLDQKLASLEQARAKVITAQYALAVAKQVYDESVGQFVDALESLVSYGLSSVFGKPYKFKIDYRAAGVSFLVASEDTADEFVSPMDSKGGGVIQIISFILHVYAINSSSADKVLLLDEPFNNLSRAHKPALAALIIELSEKLGFQFVMVSHDSELVHFLSNYPKSVTYRVSMENSASVIREVI